MNTLQIQIPDGYQVDKFDETTGEIKFKAKPKKATERIKTIEDILQDNETCQDEIDEMFWNAPEHLKHQYIAELLVKSLNEGWEPDWTDNNQWKHYPWFKMSSSGFRSYSYDGWGTASVVGYRLCFKSRELAMYAGEQFTDLYKKFMITN